MNNHNELLASQRVLTMLESACEYSEQILDNIPSVFVVLNEENRVIRANKAFCDLVGCTFEGALHLDFTAFFTSENREILLHHVNHMRTSGSSTASARVKLEIGGLTEHQPASRFLWRIFPLEHISEAEGRVISLVGDDLSGLYQSELKLMNIFSSIPIGLMMMECDGVISEVLSEYCYVLLNKRVLVGESLEGVFSKHNPALRMELARSFERLRSCAGETSDKFTEREGAHGALGRLNIKGDEGADKWVRPRFQPIVKNNRVDRYMVILEDETASHQAQQQIEKADLLGRQAQALYECAIRDPLSGLYTRLFMNDSISRLVASAGRGNFHELALVMFDIDNFKRVNDGHGHAVGDVVIREFGRIILKCIRETDVAVRYGGEEFLLALPTNTPHDHGGLIVAERIRSCLEQTPIDIGNGKTLHVTVSCGVAYCNKDDSIETLINRADKYLYDAKHGGKNRVCAEPERITESPSPQAQ